MLKAVLSPPKWATLPAVAPSTAETNAPVFLESSSNFDNDIVRTKILQQPPLFQNPYAQKIQKIEADLRSILESKMSDDQKAMLYQSALSGVLAVDRKRKTIPPAEKDKDNTPKSAHPQPLPGTFRYVGNWPPYTPYTNAARQGIAYEPENEGPDLNEFRHLARPPLAEEETLGHRHRRKKRRHTSPPFTPPPTAPSRNGTRRNLMEALEDYPEETPRRATSSRRARSPSPSPRRLRSRSGNNKKKK